MQKLFFNRLTAFFSLLLAITLASQPILACSWDYLIWQNRHKNSDPYYRFIKNGKAGFIDRTGKVVIEPSLRVYGNYQEGIINRLLRVDYDKYVDTQTGKKITREFYEQNTKVIRNLERKTVKNKRGFVDKKGNFVIDPKFVYAENFSEGFAAVVVEGPCVYSPSKSVCPGSFYYPTRKIDVLPTSACKFGYINKKGELISKPQFLEAEEFSEGLAAVRTEKGWGYIDKYGDVVIKPQFKFADSFSEGLAVVKRNDSYGYIDRTGNFIIKPTFKRAGSFSDGRALVGSFGKKTVDNQFYYIDESGLPVTNTKYLLASDYFKGIAHVLVSETRENMMKKEEMQDIRTRNFAYIDREGNEVFTYSVKAEM